MAMGFLMLRWAASLVCFLMGHIMASLFSIAAIYLLTRRSRWLTTERNQMMSPDTISSLFPDRPIRPLPKRRLRERLSPEVADSIKYPSSTLDNVPLFYYPPYTLKEEAGSGPQTAESTSPVDQSRRPDLGRVFTPLRNGLRLGVGDGDGNGLRSTLIARTPAEILSRAARTPSRPDQPRPGEPQPPPSAASSVDGYDSFENTNNKKKRKIPSAGDSVLNGAHSLNNEISSLAISTGAHSPTNDANGDRPHHGSAGYSTPGPYTTNNQGFSGPGRGRLGRSRSGRSPLRALADGNSAWPARASRAGASQWPPGIRSGWARQKVLARVSVENQFCTLQPSRPNMLTPIRQIVPFHSMTVNNTYILTWLHATVQEGAGIISSAIANAEKLPPQGQENVSLLQQHSSIAKTTPASTQFTFTCDSQVPGTVQWPGHPNRHDMAGEAAPSMANTPNGVSHDAPAKGTGGKSGHSRRKSRRRLERELNMAARHRQQIAAENYYHHAPKGEDVWICEFCEYERIFGEPPRALIRDYEIKDRRYRQEEADRKRLLEKARAKSRKGKKSGKAPSKGGYGAHHGPDQGHSDLVGDQDGPRTHHGHCHSVQSEEDEYEDEFEDEPPSPPPGNALAHQVADSRAEYEVSSHGASLERIRAQHQAPSPLAPRPVSSSALLRGLTSLALFNGIAASPPIATTTIATTRARFGIPSVRSPFRLRLRLRLSLVLSLPSRPLSPSLALPPSALPRIASSLCAAAAKKTPSGAPSTRQQCSQVLTRLRNLDHALPVWLAEARASRPATAAASAFMRHDSNASLSSAAAAAALRARPMSPTNVADVQSKRVRRRSPSMASMSGRDRVSRGDLQRTPSVGSMTERTFRSPSPARSPAPQHRNAPPVPSIPDVDRIVAGRKPPNGGQRKGATLQTQPLKLASEKMRDGRQGSWFGGATAGDPGNVRTSDSVMHSAAGVPEPRPGSVSPSINFSYPRARTPSPSPFIDSQTLVYDPNSRRLVPWGELVARSRSVRQVSEKPKKKKQDTTRTGSHLSRGTVGRTQAPALEAPQPLPAEPAAAPAPVPAVAPERPQAAAKKKKRKKKKAAEQPRPAVFEKQTMEQTMKQNTVDAAEVARPPIVKKPPVVEEEPECEAQEEQEEQPGQQTNPQQAVAIAPVAAAQAAKSIADGQPQSPETRQPDGAHKTRPPSESPARSAHFAPATDQLAIRHEPPPRSVSPRKSAMKLSPRGMSPSDDGSEASGRGSSPQRLEDPALARKKSVRVSWDDRNTVVVGEAFQPHDVESPPILPSPQAKKPWHSIVTKYAKKDPVNPEEVETMTPRPALPFFGSVREKKSKDPEERPLVRPSERTWSQPASALSEPIPGADLGQSSDAVIGAALIQDQASRNAANISKYREPLPLIVASAEGSAYDDDWAESSDDDLDTDVTTEPDDATETTLSKSTEGLGPEPSTPIKNAPEATTQDGEDVPIISISHPSPRPQDPRDISFSNEQLELPGVFPDEGDSADAAQGSETPAGHASADDAPSTPSRPIEPLTVTTTPIMDDIEEEEEDTDRCSVYSDAYEDLDEVDGDGFMSLDAVVESPSGGQVAKKMHEQVLAQPKERSQESSESKVEARESLDNLKSPKDWENAKAYWRSLSTDQRRQLEIEALTEGGDDAEPEKQPAAKKDGKKKATRDSTEAMAEPVQPLHDERIYQILPGTKWSDDGSDDAAKPASVLAVQPNALSENAPKLRQSMPSEQPAPADQVGHDRPGSMRMSMRTNAPAPSPAPDRAARRSHPPPTDPEMAAAASAAGVEMRRSLRAGKPNGDRLRPSVSQSGRPVSYHHPPATEPFRSHKRSLSADNLIPGGGMKPTLRRRGSDDSVSSFTRSRAGSRSEHVFRRSMRAQEPPPPSATGGSGRFSLRSLSPLAFRRNSLTPMAGTPNSFGGGGAGRMRQSLRAEPADTGSRSRLSPFKRSPSGKKAKKARGGSRFADSSDEDEGGPSFFSSRFADSSDEDDMPRPQSRGKGLSGSLRSTNGSSSMAAASAMGVTPAARNVASPDLPDSEDDVVQPTPAALPNGQRSDLHHGRSGRGTLMPLPAATEGQAAPRPSRSRRGSFMSILRRRKGPSGKISRDVGESAARRDTKLERTPEELATIRSNSLHKIGPSWPLPDEDGEEDSGDGIAVDKTGPATAHGPAASSSKTSPLLRRRSTSQGVVGLDHAPDDAEPVPPVPELPPEHKKKKFGALRKLLGIHD
ncbi:Uncharacterized protein TCAP_00895 [Tolypocladium capitatum]|uniref:Uncharacterized protein n=1 Tax=Tolypocladium capitatum TaxID=45235 RepID=A0A2K3QNT1_9HYPO|nr:Uncharacterized protein TCAP_00895 [Tolypocladium capitatum]